MDAVTMIPDSVLVLGHEVELTPPVLILVALVVVLSLPTLQSVWACLSLWLEYMVTFVPTIEVPLDNAAARDDGVQGDPIKKIELVNPKRPGTIQCFDPSTLQLLGEIPAMTAEDVNAVCLKAKKAQTAWAQTSFAQRRLVLRTIQKYVVTHVEPICRVCTRDSGKPMVDALLGEVLTTCEKIRTINAHGEEWLQKSYRPTGPMMMHKTAYVEYIPFGVLGVIAPWNYPFHNFINHIISGIFAGNAVVGKLVMAGAAKFAKPTILELGGKDPMIFCNDVKLKNVVPWAMRGCFQNCGQNCCGVERLFVYDSIFDEFIDTIVPKVKALRQGVPLATCGSDGDVDCGSMVMDQQMDIIQALIDDAVLKGATLHCGGKRNKTLAPGQFYMPTVISGITPDMRISKEELFGPVMCIVKVPKDSDEECIKLVNDCPFGLGSSVYCASQKRGLRIGEKIRSGMFTCNDFGVNYLIQSLPFGGVKESGFDRFAGPEGLRACCLERSMVVDRIPGVRTSIPSPIDYPIEKAKGLPFGNALVNLFYNESPFGKLLAILGLIKYG
eukprot:scaffold4850_cov50-Attheya_sp.AAC.12